MTTINQTIKKTIIIGSDSFIATKYYNSLHSTKKVKLITRKTSNKNGETIISDLFKINYNDLKGFDAVINFTAIVHQSKTKNHKLYKRINTLLPIHLAKESKKAGIKHFVQISTISVYGRVNRISIESQERPTDIYGKTKLDADRSLLKMHSSDFKITIIRPPMVYGGGMSPGNMMRLIQIANLGVPLPFKNINNKKDFIHVFNLIECISIVMNNDIYGVVLPTDKQPVSTCEIINLIKKNKSGTTRIVNINKLLLKLIKFALPGYYYKLFDSLTIQCNLPERLYLPRYTLEDGIKEMIKE